MSTLPLPVKWIDLGGSFLLLLAVVLRSPHPEVQLPQLIYGALWLMIGWKNRLPLIVVAGCIGIAVHSPTSASIGASDLWGLTYGFAIWVACTWIPAWVSGVGWALGALWGSLCGWVPGFWVSALVLLPKLSCLQPGRFRAMTWSGMVAGGGLMLWAIFSGRTEELFLRPGDVETYVEIHRVFQDLFQSESLLLPVLALVALFDLAQPTEEGRDQPWTFLGVLSVPILFLFVPAERSLQVVFWVAFPSLSVLMTRWTLAIPHRIPRAMLWVGFLLLGVTS